MYVVSYVSSMAFLWIVPATMMSWLLLFWQGGKVTLAAGKAGCILLLIDMVSHVGNVIVLGFLIVDAFV